MDRAPDSRTLWIYMGLATAIVWACSFLGRELWALHLPDLATETGGLWPLGPGRLAWAGLPAAALFTSAITCFLLWLNLPGPGGAGQDGGQRFLAADATCFLFLPVTALLPILIPKLGNGPLAVFLCYLALAGAKGLVAAAAAWRLFLRPARPRRALAAGLALFSLAAVLALALTSAIEPGA